MSPLRSILCAAAIAALAAPGARADPCAGDDCLDACPISGDGAYDFTFDNATSSGVSGCGGMTGIPDIWFLFTAEQTGLATFSTCGSPGGADTSITFYRGNYCTVPAFFDILDCDASSCGQQAAVTLPVRAGFTYLLRIGNQGVERGPAIETLTVATSPLPDPLDVYVDTSAAPDNSGDGLNFPWPMRTVQQAVNFAATEAAPGSHVRIQARGEPWGIGVITQTVQCGPANAARISFLGHVTGDVLNDDAEQFNIKTRADNTGVLFRIENAGTTRYEFLNTRLFSAGGSGGSPGEGGHAVVVRNSRVDFKNCDFRYNRSTAAGSDPDAGSGGSLLLVDCPEILISGTSFTYSAADLDGGAIAARNVASLTIRNALPAEDGGGGSSRAAIIPAGQKTGIPDNLFSAVDVNAGRDGGFLHATGATTVRIFSGYLDGYALRDGGDIYYHADPGAPGAGLSITRCYALGGAEFGRGGAVYAAGAPLRVCTSILSDTYSFDGGAIYLDSTGIAGTDAGSIASSLVIQHYTFDGGSAIKHASDSPRTFTLVNTILRDNQNYFDVGEPIATPVAQAGCSGAAQIACVNSNVAYLSQLSGLGPAPVSCVDAPARIDFSAMPLLYPGDAGIDAGDAQYLCADEFDLDEDGDTSEPDPYDFRGGPRILDDSQAPGTGPGPRLDIGPGERADATLARQWIGGGDGVIDDPAAYYPPGPINLKETLIIEAAPGGTTLHVPESGAEMGGLYITGDLTVDLNNAMLTTDHLRADPWPGGPPSTIQFEGPGTLNPYGVVGWLGTRIIYRNLDLLEGESGSFSNGDASYVLDHCRVSRENDFSELVWRAIAIAGESTFDAETLFAGAIGPADDKPFVLTLNRATFFNQPAFEQSPEFGFLALSLRVFDGSTTDQVTVHDALSLGGTLNVAFADTFQPPPGQPFSIPLITANSFTRQFALVNLPTLSAGRFARIVYGSTIRGSESGTPQPVATLVVEDLGQYLGFDDTEHFSAGGTPSAAAVADLDNDGDPDLALAIPGALESDPGSVILLFNAGNDLSGHWLGFTASTQFPSGGENPVALRIAELDGAPGLDLAVVNRHSDSVATFRNDGAGAFIAAFTFAAGADPRDVALGDFDSDGRADIAVATGDPAGEGFIGIFINQGGIGATWAGPAPIGPVIPTGSNDPTSINPIDIDDDKDLDLVAVVPQGFLYTFPNAGGTLRAWPGFLSPTVIPTGGQPTSINPIDIDDDKDLDLAAINPPLGAIQVFFNSGSGSYSSPASIPVGNSPRSLAFADLDRDGDPDLAAIAADEPGGPASLRVIRNDLAGGQSAFTRLPSEQPGAEPLLVLAADVDADNDDDLITITAPSMLREGRGEPAHPLITVAPSRPTCRGDTSADGTIGLADIAVIIQHWNDKVPPGTLGDADFSGAVGLPDIAAVIQAWGTSCF